jgi:hypothetical protein
MARWIVREGAASHTVLRDLRAADAPDSSGRAAEPFERGHAVAFAAAHAAAESVPPRGSTPAPETEKGSELCSYRTSVGARGFEPPTPRPPV